MFISTKEIQVTYADTDMMGVIYHANYLKWFDIGRTQLVEDLGFDYLDMEREGYYAPVFKAEVTYKKPVRYGEKIFVRTWVEENSKIKTTYGYEIVNENGEVYAQGTTTHVLVSKDTFKPVRFGKAFPDWFQKYEDIKKRTE
ncbi:MAG: acyl-CoA thioesterase [Desulfitobacteriia bacterium]|jgi:acyl-CoA thioester hydrolase